MSLRKFGSKPLADAGIVGGRVTRFPKTRSPSLPQLCIIKVGRHFGETYGTALQCWACLAAIRLRQPENEGRKVLPTLYILCVNSFVSPPRSWGIKSKTLLYSLHHGVAVLGKFGGNPAAAAEKNRDKSYAQLLYMYRLCPFCMLTVHITVLTSFYITPVVCSRWRSEVLQGRRGYY